METILIVLIAATVFFLLVSMVAAAEHRVQQQSRHIDGLRTLLKQKEDEIERFRWSGTREAIELRRQSWEDEE